MQKKFDVWRTACDLLREHGTNATLAAALKSDALLAQYDIDAHLRWKRVRNAIRELQRSRRQGEWLN